MNRLLVVSLGLLLLLVMNVYAHHENVETPMMDEDHCAMTSTGEVCEHYNNNRAMDEDHCAMTSTGEVCEHYNNNSAVEVVNNGEVNVSVNHTQGELNVSNVGGKVKAVIMFPRNSKVVAYIVGENGTITAVFYGSIVVREGMNGTLFVVAVGKEGPIEVSLDAISRGVYFMDLNTGELIKKAERNASYSNETNKTKKEKDWKKKVKDKIEREMPGAKIIEISIKAKNGRVYYHIKIERPFRLGPLELPFFKSEETIEIPEDELEAEAQ